MPTNNLHPIFTAELHEMHWFENAWVTTLGQLGRSSCLPDLGSVLKKERAYTQEHVNRLGQIYISIDEHPESQECEALSGLITDLKTACERLGGNEPSADLSFILAVIKAANYQIGAYSAMLLLAQSMQYTEAEKLITDTIGEEKQTIIDMTRLLTLYND